jgi:hypothetical protein
LEEAVKLYKITGPNGEAIYGGNGKWPLPKGKKPGAWTKKQTPVLCMSGWHLIPASQLNQWWRDGAVLWEAEGRGRSDASLYKTAFESARLVRRVGTLDAAAYAEYKNVTAPVWAKYVKVKATALAEYEKVTAPVWAEYEKACEAAIEKVWRKK